MDSQNTPVLTPEARLYAKLARVMGKMSRLRKTGRNLHFGYDFATDADVADLVRKELAEEKVAFFASMVESVQEHQELPAKGGGTRRTTKTIAKFEFTFACGDTGATRTCQWQAEAQDDQDKGYNKVATAAEKYFLLKTFMISTGDPADDPDGDVDKAKPEAANGNEPISADDVKAKLGNGSQRRIGSHWWDENEAHFGSSMQTLLGMSAEETLSSLGIENPRAFKRKEELWAEVKARVQAKRLPMLAYSLTYAGKNGKGSYVVLHSIYDVRFYSRDKLAKALGEGWEWLKKLAEGERSELETPIRINTWDAGEGYNVTADVSAQPAMEPA